MTKRALELAARGIGQVSPGPLVGCVVVDRAGNTVGEGTYYFDEITHAEVMALEEAGEKARGGTAYISLEPHSHHGRTPPCTEALIDAGIRRVVVPIEDPNPLVSGNGFTVLKQHGVKVDQGILRSTAEKQNEKFIHWHRARKPFVHLKIAASLDGMCATRTGDSKWITGEAARNKGQLLRHEYDSILVGIGTVKSDNPNLTDRSGLPRNRKLTRVILDNKLQIGLESNLVQTAKLAPTLVFCDPGSERNKIRSLEAKGVDVFEQKGGGRDLEAVLGKLAKLEIQSVMVEGGPSVSGSFLDQGLVDKITVFVAPLIIGGAEAKSAVGGLGPAKLADSYRLRDISTESHGADFEVTGYPEASSSTGEKSG